MIGKSHVVAILSLFQIGLWIAEAFVTNRCGTNHQVNHNQSNNDRLKFFAPFPSSCLSLSAEAEEGQEETAVQNETEEKPNDESSGDNDAANDILNSPAFLKRKLEVLENDINSTEENISQATERMEVAKEEWGPQLDALQKEYSNVQERMSSQNQAGDKEAIVRVVTKILENLLDNFDRASGAIIPETDSEKEIEAAYGKAYQDILDQFKILGVTEVETLGTEFDYEFHQAVMQMPGTEYEEGIVCKEFQKGFKMENGKNEDGEDVFMLIRPAMVAVAA